MAPTRFDRIVAPRLGARLALGGDASLKAGLARYLRLPTALELFGDHGLVVGNPDLRPERGWSGELGALWAPATARGIADRLWLEVVGFAAASSDTIVMTPSAALVVAPQNLGDARILGGELTAAVRLWRALGLRLQYTAMVTRQVDTRPSYEGEALPHRPRHRGFARVELAGRPGGRLAVGWATTAVTVGEHLDPAGLSEVPRRVLVGAGAKVGATDDLLVGLELENLLDARVESIALDPAPRPDLARIPRAIADVYGYPLPGRALYLTLTWEPSS
jgi:outer membrane receptor protein involved in Fe transport